MIQQLTIPGTLPDLNEMIAAAKVRRGNWCKYNDLKDHWTGVVAIYAHLQKLQPIPGAHFRFEWHRKNKRIDPDNISAGAKFVLDALVKAGIIENDGWSEVLSITHTFTKATENKVIIIMETEEENEVSQGLPR